MEKKSISARLDKKTIDAVKSQAKKENRSFNNMLEVILQRWAKEEKAA